MKNNASSCALFLAFIGLVSIFSCRAQQPTVTINDPVEYQAYTAANTQTDSKTKAAAFERFLADYPKSLLRQSVLGQLEDIYQGLADQAAARAQSGANDAQAEAMQEAIEASNRELAAASRLLQMDPTDLKATLLSVVIKRQEGQRENNAKTLDDSARQARDGLQLKKPADMSDADWAKLTAAAFPAFHAAIAVSAEENKDFKTAIDEYLAALAQYPSDATESGPALLDTYQIARTYAQPGIKDPVKSIWFYARAWEYAPPRFKPQIEAELEQIYAGYHGGLDGLEDVKKQTTASLFPPASFSIKSAKDRIHDFLGDHPEQSKLSLADVETVLAAGYQEDADRVWAMLKDQSTPVPGTVIATTSSLLKVAVTEAGTSPKQAQTKEYLVGLRIPLSCEDAQPPSVDLKKIEEFILAKGAKEDTEKLARLFQDNPGRIRKVVLDPAASTVEVAVTQDAKNSKSADFIVNLKTPIACKTLSKREFGMQPAIELDGTYDSYRQIAATSTAVQSVQIVLRDGSVQPEKRKPVSRRPPSTEHKASHS